MPSSKRARAAVIAAGILFATSAAAQDPPAQNKPPAPAGDAPAAQPPPVRPMSMQPEAMTSTPTGKAIKRTGRWTQTKRRGAAAATTGPIAGAPAFFRLDDGSTRVSLEVSDKVTIVEGHAQGRLIYRLKGAAVTDRVNTLPLLTGYFPTPVDRAQLTPDGPDLVLTIDLRGATTPAFRVVETPRGIVMQVDFPRVAGADKSYADAQDSGARERARRRSEGQTLSGDKKVNRNDE